MNTPTDIFADLTARDYRASYNRRDKIVYMAKHQDTFVVGIDHDQQYSHIALNADKGFIATRSVWQDDNVTLTELPAELVRKQYAILARYRDAQQKKPRGHNFPQFGTVPKGLNAAVHALAQTNEGN